MPKLNSINVGRIYDECIYLSSISAITLEVNTPWKGRERFIQSKLKERTRDIAGLLIRLDKRLMRSEGNGDAYLWCRYEADGTPWCATLKPLQKLISLGIAANLIVLSEKNAHMALRCNEIPAIIIEDYHIHKLLANHLI